MDINLDMPKFYSPEEALQRLRDMSSEESEGETSTNPDHEILSSESDQVSDSTSSISLECSSEESSSEDEPDISRHSNTSNQAVSVHRYKSADGHQWNKISSHQQSMQTGRRQSENVLRKTPGPTAYACRRIEDGSFKSAFSLFVDSDIVSHIKHCTDIEAARVRKQDGWSVTVAEIHQFIGILYLKGVLLHKNTPILQLWSKQWGLKCITSVMSRKRFLEIMRYMRFDQRSTRSHRLKTDKFALVNDIFEPFRVNLTKCYNPHESVTIDEQLFPCKARCPFTQYIAQKPDKFGIKFWLAADVKSKYLLNAYPYTGKDSSRPAQIQLGEHVTLQLMTPYMNCGLNVTTDSFFTSLSLANKLLAKRTTLVGTLRQNRREIPENIKDFKNKAVALYSSTIMQEQTSKITITAYKAKATKSVFLLSSVHKKDIAIDEGVKKKPEPVLYYNNTKYGVDILDQMARYHTTKIGSRRWPMQVFFNILDLAAINARIVYKEVVKVEISRRNFLIKLGEQLTGRNQDEDAPNVQQDEATGDSTPSESFDKKRRKCQIRLCKNNLGSYVCRSCKKVACGKCTAQKFTERICKKCK